MDAIRTHRRLDPRLTGTPEELGDGHSEVVLVPGPETAADETGLVHGGFVFGLADHAAMLAVNHANVVLAGAQVRFLAPVTVGERLVARARRLSEEGSESRPVVEVEVLAGGEPVFAGTFRCAVPAEHVLARGPRGRRQGEEGAP
jgi:acyl-coenzyme A thioesterase PaaI-like protein